MPLEGEGTIVARAEKYIVLLVVLSLTLTRPAP
jgi:hypothetical protein